MLLALEVLISEHRNQINLGGPPNPFPRPTLGHNHLALFLPGSSTCHPDHRSLLPRAVLGPTNTGKTYLAMERMLGHASGMMGFPLRLLARENYERAVAKAGKAKVALITGEEKIIPPRGALFSLHGGGHAA